MAITLNTLNNGAPSRYLGGSGQDVHPYVKGYFYVWFKFPPLITSTDQEEANNTLLTLSEGFTPPGDRQLKTEDVQGLGGLDSTFITGQTLDRSFSIQYKDLWGAPVFRIHRAWSNIIKPHLGLADRKAGVEKFIPTEYKGRCIVIQTKPIITSNGKESPIGTLTTDSNAFKSTDIIKVDLFDGVIPTVDLSSVYDSNISDNSIVKPSVQYRFDGAKYDETDEGVLTLATSILNKNVYNTKTIGQSTKMTDKSLG